MAMGHLCDLKAYPQKNERDVINYREWRDAGRRISTSAVEHGQSINRTPNVQGATHVLEQTGYASTSAGALCNFERRPASGIPALVSVCRDTTSHDALGLVTPSFVTVPNDTVLRQIHTGAS